MASLEYLAGLFDGEGTFTLQRQKKVLSDGTVSWYAVPLVSITNTDKRLLDVVVDRWGRQGALTQEKLKANHKDRYTWYSQCGVAASICDQLLPYLVGKKQQAYIVSMIDKVNKAWKRKYVGTNRRTPEWKIWLHEMAINRVRQLNKRGTDV